MAMKIKGERVYLVTRKAVPDAYNHPTWVDHREAVDNVLIGEPTQTEVENSLDVKHERTSYMLAIPKGDAHDWQDAEVEFWGRRWRQVGRVTQGMDHLIPLDWNKKVMVEEII